MRECAKAAKLIDSQLCISACDPAPSHKETVAPRILFYSASNHSLRGLAVLPVVLHNFALM